MSDMLTEEKQRLARVAETYDTRATFDYHLVRYGARIILDHAAGPAVLEMGCGTGVMTEELVRHFPNVVVVDGSSEYLERTRRLVGDRATFHLALFEEFVPNRTFNAIVMANILEHVVDPVGLLGRAGGWLARDGAIHVIVPNAASLHRRIGLAMGMLSRLDELNDRDRAVGHRRVYTFESLARDIRAAGLDAAHLTGLFLKPLSNDQMAQWPKNVLDALLEVGGALPTYCAHIYARCAPRA